MRTIVILGASNGTIGLPLIWSGLVRSLDEPFRLVIAAGHGRSYGMPSTVMGRTLPSLQECGLWQFLQSSTEKSDTTALITDVGNDLLYGAGADQTLEWVHVTLNRLAPHVSGHALTELPIHSLQDLSRARFNFFRTILFPQSKLTFESAHEQGTVLNDAIVRLAKERIIPCVNTNRHWYGLDPIHVRRRYRPEAWSRYLSPLLAAFEQTRPGPLFSSKIWMKKPERRWRGKRLLESAQPAFAQGGNELWLF